MATATETSIEQKLKALYKLQLIDSKIGKLTAIRGELPMEVSDLEDEIIGQETRLNNLKADVTKLEEAISVNKTKIIDAKALVKKYEKQLENVKNNREFDALNKEIEIQGLEQQALEKRIKNTQFDIEQKKMAIDTLQKELEGRAADLNNKKAELDNIVAETQKEEDELLVIRASAVKIADERLVHSYDRIRKSVKNGIGVATIERESCSGCFAGIPPQRQSDIKQRKKIIVCENCGRVLTDALLAEEVAADFTV
ncbi:MAG: C4-type zinc ribbon domain-containing protein [Bacteroidota bacterium]|nr:C4-type zinc ribbon domain-containing protein [Bacteroidota bacterium]